MPSLYQTYSQKVKGWSYGKASGYSTISQDAIAKLGGLYVQQGTDATTKRAIFPYHITPRMAYKLHASGCLLLDELIGSTKVWASYLPSIAKSFSSGDSNKEWRQQFIASIQRILMRLVKGRGMAPNCTAEEVAAFIMINIAENIFGDIELGFKYKEWTAFSKHKLQDKDYSKVREYAIKDETVLMAFDEEEDDDTLSLYAIHIMDSSVWFMAIDEERKEDHLSTMEVIE